MKQLHSILKAINTAVRSIAAIAVAGTLLFSGYMIWDNHQVYAAAENVLLAEDDHSLSFEELLQINPDVKLWLKLDGTEIDAPVAQGKDNYYYLNRDVLCKSSMAGALFLDARNAGDFSDIYNIIYGHHMKGSLMFGDLDYYMDEDFFDANTTGTIQLPDSTKSMETVAVMKVLDSTKEIFRPSIYTDDLSGLCQFIENNAMHISNAALAKLKAHPDSYQVTALVTCTDGSTGTRLVLLVMTEYDKPDKPIDPDNPHGDDPHGNDPVNPPPKTGFDDHLVLWIGVVVFSGLIFFGTALLLKKRLASNESERRKR